MEREEANNILHTGKDYKGNSYTKYGGQIIGYSSTSSMVAEGGPCWVLPYVGIPSLFSLEEAKYFPFNRIQEAGLSLKLGEVAGITYYLTRLILKLNSSEHYFVFPPLLHLSDSPNISHALGEQVKTNLDKRYWTESPLPWGAQ